MVPVPQARPKRIDVVYARPRPAESIAIAVAELDGGYRYAAVGELWSCTGSSEASNAELAVLDAIEAVRARRVGNARFRFVLNLPSGSPLWRLKGQLEGVAMDWWIERPDQGDQPLIVAADAQISSVLMMPLPVDQGHVTVATDGSVRGKYAGTGWLSSSGEYGLDGFWSSPKRVGSDPVLVAELRAIGSAVSTLTRHHLTVLSDSQCAVAMVRRWQHGEWRMPAGYPAEPSARKRCLHAVRQRICDDRDRLDVRWARGHCGEPLNEGADALARLGSRYRQGDPDLKGGEYEARAAGIAQAFAAEYRRVNAAVSA